MNHDDILNLNNQSKSKYPKRKLRLKSTDSLKSGIK